MEYVTNEAQQRRTEQSTIVLSTIETLLVSRLGKKKTRKKKPSVLVHVGEVLEVHLELLPLLLVAHDLAAAAAATPTDRR